MCCQELKSEKIFQRRFEWHIWGEKICCQVNKKKVKINFKENLNDTSEALKSNIKSKMFKENESKTNNKCHKIYH